MKIALDVRYRTDSGASSYIQNIVPKLVRLNSSYEFILVKFEHQQILGVEKLDAIICPGWGVGGQILWDQFILPFRLKANRVDVYHTLKMLGSFFSFCPQIKVAHSITSPFRGEFPGTLAQKIYWNVLGNRLYKNSDHVIAVSEYVKDFLTEALKIPESKIDVVYNGIDPCFTQAQKESELGKKSFIDAPYLLTVGNIFPVKNHIIAVKAFYEILSVFPDHHLLMAGRTDHECFKNIDDFIKEKGFEDKVHFLGFVNTEDLVNLYKNAQLLMMPSLTEGCPVTLLEAMSCGTAVVGSGRGGIPEVGADAIDIVEDPHDLSSWVYTISSVMASNKRKKMLREKALERSRDFDWDKAAIETSKCYKRFDS